MRHNAVETGLACIVAAAAVAFGVQLLAVDQPGGADGYTLAAEFDDVGALRAGDPVFVAGLRVGDVSALQVDPDTLFAIVEMTIDPQYRLPADSRAGVGSGGLTGGASIVLTPGDSRAVAPNGGIITDTVGAVNPVDALARRIFSAGGTE
ncbi:MAG: MlaD family protein [Pseudomonadota bacterium]